jgi:NTE family protein
MTTGDQARPTRALVLGGGGVTGIAWEVGVLSGLLSAGVDLRNADVVIGTSAGAYVGAAYASGYDIEHLFARQLESDDAEVAAAASEATVAEWLEAFRVGGADRAMVGAEFGKIAKAHPEPIPLERRRAVVEARLVVREWPPGLRVTAIDAETGELRAFDSQSGVALLDAVSASGAVPGVWPLERINDRWWIDGGMVSTANTRLADGYDRVLVIAPMPSAFGDIPGAGEDVAAMSADAAVMLTSPDERSAAAIGPNPFDPQRRASAASAGREQGVEEAGAVGALWSGAANSSTVTEEQLRVGVLAERPSRTN